MIDLFAGLGGWAEGGLAEGYRVVGFDLERHHYGDHRYPASLVVQDVRTLHGRQFRDATLIVASPPCQEYSYMAMPWTRAKRLAQDYRDGTRDARRLTELFDACFRIQREACEAAGRPIPLVVENVCGAQKWVGRARWHYGSYYLWGDMPALMPIVPTRSAFKGGDRNMGRVHGTHEWNHHFADVYKSNGMNWSDRSRRGQDFTRIAGNQAIKNADHVKQGGDWFNETGPSQLCSFGSKSPKRKAASALIAKIPFELARHIGAMYRGAR